MAVDSCAIENPVAEIVVAVPTTAEESAGTSNCGIASPSDDNTTCINKRPSPIPVSDSKYESPMKKVLVETVAEEPVEAIGGEGGEGAGGPVEEQPVDEEVVKGEATDEKPKDDGMSLKAPEEEVLVIAPVGEVEPDDKTSEPVQAAEGD